MVSWSRGLDSTVSVPHLISFAFSLSLSLNSLYGITTPTPTPIKYEQTRHILMPRNFIWN